MAERLTDAQVRHVAKLTRLKLTEEQVARMAEQLSSVLGYVAKLEEVDVAGVEPLAHPVELHNRFRADEAGTALGVEAALSTAPEKDPPYFKVPKVLGDGGGA